MRISLHTGVAEEWMTVIDSVRAAARCRNRPPAGVMDISSQ